MWRDVLFSTTLSNLASLWIRFLPIIYSLHIFSVRSHLPWLLLVKTNTFPSCLCPLNSCAFQKDNRKIVILPRSFLSRWMLIYVKRTNTEFLKNIKCWKIRKCVQTKKNNNYILTVVLRDHVRQRSPLLTSSRIHI